MMRKSVNFANIGLDSLQYDHEEWDAAGHPQLTEVGVRALEHANFCELIRVVGFPFDVLTPLPGH